MPKAVYEVSNIARRTLAEGFILSSAVEPEVIGQCSSQADVLFSRFTLRLEDWTEAQFFGVKVLKPDSFPVEF